jgi:hypothetical protein
MPLLLKEQTKADILTTYYMASPDSSLGYSFQPYPLCRLRQYGLKPLKLWALPKYRLSSKDAGKPRNTWQLGYSEILRFCHAPYIGKLLSHKWRTRKRLAMGAFSQQHQTAIALFIATALDRRDQPLHLNPRQMFAVAHHFVESLPYTTGLKPLPHRTHLSTPSTIRFILSKVVND